MYKRIHILGIFNQEKQFVHLVTPIFTMIRILLIDF